MLQKNTVQPELLERIRKAQNAVAALESENMLRNAEKDYEKQLEDLRNMVSFRYFTYGCHTFVISSSDFS